MDMVEEQVQFPVGTDRCEGVLSYPEQAEPQHAMLLLAPHPLLGGDMENNVVRHLARRCAQEGAATLRFNYRGVGRNTLAEMTGAKAWTHFKEMEDKQAYHVLMPEVQAAARFLKSVTQIPCIDVIGYSLGAILAGALAQEGEVSTMFCISPPNAKVDLDKVYQCCTRKVFVGGTNDPFFHAADFQRLFERMPKPKSLLMFPGADHFYRQEEEQLFMLLRPMLVVREGG